LTVRIANAGGLLGVSDRPVPKANVTAKGADDHKWQATTNSSGIARLHLGPGYYSVYSTRCGTGPQEVQLTAGTSTTVQIICPVF
jgi:hypothetical protein